MRDDQLTDIALAFDGDDERVRRQVAEWLRGCGAFATGLARSLMRRNRDHVYVSTRRSQA